MLKGIILLVLMYVVVWCIAIYNTDAKLKVKIKDKLWGDKIIALLLKVREKHRVMYKDSELEDAVDDIKKDGAKVVAQAKAKAAEVAQDLKEEATEVVAQAKEKVEKVTSEVVKVKASNSESSREGKTSATKTSKKSESKVNKAAPSNSESSREGKAKATTKKK